MIYPYREVGGAHRRFHQSVARRVPWMYKIPPGSLYLSKSGSRVFSFLSGVVAVAVGAYLAIWAPSR